jgi:hypothetical protein
LKGPGNLADRLPALNHSIFQKYPTVSGDIRFFFSHHHCPLPARNLSVQIIEFFLRLFERRERLFIRHTLDLAEAIDQTNNLHGFCTDRCAFSRSVLPALAE